MAFCNRLNKRLDAADRQAYMEWQLPTQNQYVVAHSWQQDHASFYQPDRYPPAYANRADHSLDWQHLRPPDATLLYGKNHQFGHQHWHPTAQPYHPPAHMTWQVPAEPLPLHSRMNSCWYPPPPRSPTSWDPSGQHASQGYPGYDQSPPPDWPAKPPQCSPELPKIVDVDVGYMKHPFGEETWVMAYEIDDPFTHRNSDGPCCSCPASRRYPASTRLFASSCGWLLGF